MRDLLTRIKEFFKKRHMGVKSGVLSDWLNTRDSQETRAKLLDITFAISFMCRDVSKLLLFRKQFFASVLTSHKGRSNPLSLFQTLQIVNDTHHILEPIETMSSHSRTSSDQSSLWDLNLGETKLSLT